MRQTSRPAHPAASAATSAEAGVAGLLRRCDASADTLVRTIVKVASGEGDVPPDLLGRLLEKDPARRFQTPAELRTELERLLELLPP